MGSDVSPLADFLKGLPNVSVSMQDALKTLGAALNSHSKDAVALAAGVPDPDWNPLDHPRDPEGKFVKKGMGSFIYGKAKKANYSQPGGPEAGIPITLQPGDKLYKTPSGNGLVVHPDGSGTVHSYQTGHKIPVPPDHSLLKANLPMVDSAPGVEVQGDSEEAAQKQVDDLSALKQKLTGKKTPKETKQDYSTAVSNSEKKPISHPVTGEQLIAGEGETLYQNTDFPNSFLIEHADGSATKILGDGKHIVGTMALKAAKKPGQTTYKPVNGPQDLVKTDSEKQVKGPAKKASAPAPAASKPYLDPEPGQKVVTSANGNLFYLVDKSGDKILGWYAQSSGGKLSTSPNVLSLLQSNYNNTKDKDAKYKVVADGGDPLVNKADGKPVTYKHDTGSGTLDIPLKSGDTLYGSTSKPQHAVVLHSDGTGTFYSATKGTSKPLSPENAAFKKAKNGTYPKITDGTAEAKAAEKAQAKADKEKAAAEKKAAAPKKKVTFGEGTKAQAKKQAQEAKSKSTTSYKHAPEGAAHTFDIDLKPGDTVYKSPAPGNHAVVIHADGTADFYSVTKGTKKALTPENAAYKKAVAGKYESVAVNIGTEEPKSPLPVPEKKPEPVSFDALSNYPLQPGENIYQNSMGLFVKVSPDQSSYTVLKNDGTDGATFKDQGESLKESLSGGHLALMKAGPPAPEPEAAKEGWENPKVQAKLKSITKPGEQVYEGHPPGGIEFIKFNAAGTSVKIYSGEGDIIDSAYEGNSYVETLKGYIADGSMSYKKVYSVDPVEPAKPEAPSYDAPGFGKVALEPGDAVHQTTSGHTVVMHADGSAHFYSANTGKSKSLPASSKAYKEVQSGKYPKVADGPEKAAEAPQEAPADVETTGVDDLQPWEKALLGYDADPAPTSEVEDSTLQAEAKAPDGPIKEVSIYGQTVELLPSEYLMDSNLASSVLHFDASGKIKAIHKPSGPAVTSATALSSWKKTFEDNKDKFKVMESNEVDSGDDPSEPKPETSSGYWDINGAAVFKHPGTEIFKSDDDLHYVFQNGEPVYVVKPDPSGGLSYTAIAMPSQKPSLKQKYADGSIGTLVESNVKPPAVGTNKTVFHHGKAVVLKQGQSFKIPKAGSGTYGVVIENGKVVGTYGGNGLISNPNVNEAWQYVWDEPGGPEQFTTIADNGSDDAPESEDSGDTVPFLGHDVSLEVGDSVYQRVGDANRLVVVSDSGEIKGYVHYGAGYATGDAISGFGKQFIKKFQSSPEEFVKIYKHKSQDEKDSETAPIAAPTVAPAPTSKKFYGWDIEWGEGYSAYVPKGSISKTPPMAIYDGEGNFKGTVRAENGLTGPNPQSESVWNEQFEAGNLDLVDDAAGTTAPKIYGHDIPWGPGYSTYTLKGTPNKKPNVGIFDEEGTFLGKVRATTGFEEATSAMTTVWGELMAENELEEVYLLDPAPESAPSAPEPVQTMNSPVPHADVPPVKASKSHITGVQWTADTDYTDEQWNHYHFASQGKKNNWEIFTKVHGPPEKYTDENGVEHDIVAGQSLAQFKTLKEAKQWVAANAVHKPAQKAVAAEAKEGSIPGFNTVEWEGQTLDLSFGSAAYEYQGNLHVSTLSGHFMLSPNGAVSPSMDYHFVAAKKYGALVTKVSLPKPAYPDLADSGTAADLEGSYSVFDAYRDKVLARLSLAAEGYADVLTAQDVADLAATAVKFRADNMKTLSSKEKTELTRAVKQAEFLNAYVKVRDAQAAGTTPSSYDSAVFLAAHESNPFAGDAYLPYGSANSVNKARKPAREALVLHRAASWGINLPANWNGEVSDETLSQIQNFALSKGFEWAAGLDANTAKDWLLAMAQNKLSDAAKIAAPAKQKLMFANAISGYKAWESKNKAHSKSPAAISAADTAQVYKDAIAASQLKTAYTVNGNVYTFNASLKAFTWDDPTTFTATDIPIKEMLAEVNNGNAEPASEKTVASKFSTAGLLSQEFPGWEGFSNTELSKLAEDFAGNSFIKHITGGGKIWAWTVQSNNPLAEGALSANSGAMWQTHPLHPASNEVAWQALADLVDSNEQLSAIRDNGWGDVAANPEAYEGLPELLGLEAFETGPNAAFFFSTYMVPHLPEPSSATAAQIEPVAQDGAKAKDASAMPSTPPTGVSKDMWAVVGHAVNGNEAIPASEVAGPAPDDLWVEFAVAPHMVAEMPSTVQSLMAWARENKSYSSPGHQHAIEIIEAVKSLSKSGMWAAEGNSVTVSTDTLGEVKLNLLPGDKVYTGNSDNYYSQKYLFIQHLDGGGYQMRQYGSSDGGFRYQPLSMPTLDSLSLIHDEPVDIDFDYANATVGISEKDWALFEKSASTSFNQFNLPGMHQEMGDTLIALKKAMEKDETLSTLTGLLPHIPQGTKKLLHYAIKNGHQPIIDLVKMKAKFGHYESALSAASGPTIPPNASYASLVSQGHTSIAAIFQNWSDPQVEAAANDLIGGYKSYVESAKELSDFFKANLTTTTTEVDGVVVEKTAPQEHVPFGPHLELYKASLGLDGMHSKGEWSDQFGNAWMSKSFPNSEPEVARMRIEAEHYSMEIARLMGFNAPESRIMEVEGSLAYVQHLTPASDSFRYKDWNDIFEETMAQALSYHIADWGTSDHDRHEGNLLIAPNGVDVIAIDRGQAFKFFPQDQLAEGFLPPGNPEPVWYDKPYAALRTGQMPKETADKMLDRVLRRAAQYSTRNDDAYRENLERALAHRTNFPKKYPTREAFIDALMDRKHNVFNDFRDLYADLYQQAGYEYPAQDAVLDDYMPKKVGQAHVTVSADFVEDVKNSGSQGQAIFFAGTELEDGHVQVFTTTDSAGGVTLRGETRLRPDAGNTFVNWINQHTVENSAGGGYGNALYANAVANTAAKLPGLDAVHSMLVGYTKTVSTHAADGQYNTGIVAQAEKDKETLKKSIADVEKHIASNPEEVYGGSVLGSGSAQLITAEQQDAWLAAAKTLLENFEKVDNAKSQGKKVSQVYPEQGHFQPPSYKPSAGLDTSGNPKVLKSYEYEGVTYSQWSDGNYVSTDKDGKKSKVPVMMFDMAAQSGTDVTPDPPPESETETVTATAKVLGKVLHIKRQNATHYAGNFNPETGTVTGTTENGAGSGDFSGLSGTEYEISFEGVTVKYLHHEDTSTSTQGLLRFTVDDWNSTPESLDEVFAVLRTTGLTLGEADETELELLYWRQLEGHLRDRNDAASSKWNKVLKAIQKARQDNPNLTSAEEVEAMREAWKMGYGSETVDRLTSTRGYLPQFGSPKASSQGKLRLGRPKWFRPDVSMADYYKWSGGKLAKRSNWDTSSSGYIKAGKNALSAVKSGGLLPTDERTRVLGKAIGGASSSSDQGYGSAQFAFFRQNLGVNSGSYETFAEPHTFFWSHNYAFDTDRYGDVDERSNYSPFDLQQQSNMKGSSNEIMMKYGLSIMDDVAVMHFPKDSPGGSETLSAVLKYFKDLGITEIRGIPVEERFVDTPAKAQKTMKKVWEMALEREKQGKTIWETGE